MPPKPTHRNRSRAARKPGGMTPILSGEVVRDGLIQQIEATGADLAHRLKLALEEALLR